MDSIDKLQPLIDSSKVRAAITWHDLTLGLWAGLVGILYGVVRFLKWFALREIDRFLTDVHKRLTERVEEQLRVHKADLEHSLEKRLETHAKEINLRLDTVVREQAETNKNTKAYHAKEDSVLQEILNTLGKLPQQDSQHNSKDF
jgi:hypothetical protein